MPLLRSSSTTYSSSSSVTMPLAYKGYRVGGEDVTPHDTAPLSHQKVGSVAIQEPGIAAIEGGA